MKNLFILNILILFSVACGQKQTTASIPKGTAMSRGKDTIIGIKGCEKARYTETKLGHVFTYAQATVTTVASEEGVGEEIYVTSPNQKDTFGIENIDAYHFIGIKNDLLFVDNGTGPNGRSLLVYDLKTRKLTHEAHYEGDLSIAEGKITYKTPIDTRRIRLMASVCPDKEKWEKQGFSAGYAQFVVFDLTTKEATPTGEYTCYIIQ